MASNEDILNKISVKDVAKKFLIKSDEILANKLQTEECFDHFKKNRFLKQVNRENIQKSIPLAKTIETVENEKLMNTRISHEHQKEIEQSDELIAYELHQHYLKELESEQQRKDEELAKMLQQEEILNDPIHNPVSTTTPHKNLNINYNNDESYYHDPDDEDDDYSLAMYLQQEEQKKIELQNQKHAVLINDEELARRLQESENSRLNGNLYSTHQKSLHIVSCQNISDFYSSLASSTTTTTTTQSSYSLNNYSRLVFSARPLDDDKIVRTLNRKMSYNYDSLNSSSKNTDNSYEEDSLIEPFESKNVSKENIYNFRIPKKSGKKELLKKIEDSTPKNVIASIDPTYTKKLESCELKFNKENDNYKMSCSKSKKSGYSSLGDNDTEIFLPIQGQKRGTLKPVKKKKSQAQCLQQ